MRVAFAASCCSTLWLGCASEPVEPVDVTDLRVDSLSEAVELYNSTTLTPIPAHALAGEAPEIDIVDRWIGPPSCVSSDPAALAVCMDGLIAGEYDNYWGTYDVRDDGTVPYRLNTATGMGLETFTFEGIADHTGTGSAAALWMRHRYVTNCAIDIESILVFERYAPNEWPRGWQIVRVVDAVGESCLSPGTWWWAYMPTMYRFD